MVHLLSFALLVGGWMTSCCSVSYGMSPAACGAGCFSCVFIAFYGPWCSDDLADVTMALTVVYGAVQDDHLLAGVSCEYHQEDL